MSVRVVVRSLSELCITVGAVIVLFVVYVLFWTGVKADSAMHHQIDVLHDQWAERPAATAPPSQSPAQEVPPSPAAYKDGEPFAVM
ncbi:class E sortase, partial [Streptomyces sp. NPDC046939]